MSRMAEAPKAERVETATGESPFATIEEAIEEIRAGRIVIVVDDADRENEGDFIMAAEKVTAEAINFMVTHGRGIVCMPVAGYRLDELGIPLMVGHREDGHETAFAISIDVKDRTTTGTSALIVSMASALCARKGPGSDADQSAKRTGPRYGASRSPRRRRRSSRTSRRRRWRRSRRCTPRAAAHEQR